MRRLFPTLPLIALAFAVFAAWMHLAVLDPSNVGWLLVGSDRGQAMMGLSAYLRIGGPWPLTHSPLLGTPDGSVLLLTDSIPLLGIMLKPFAWALPDHWQYVGTWYLLCLVLHVLFAWKLIRPQVTDPVVAWLGTALLTLMPVLINRWVHASLASQWLLLWAFWLFLNDRRDRHALRWALLLGITALVHNYLLLMVAGIWSGSVLRALVREPDRFRTLAGATLPIAVVTAMVLLHGVLGLSFISTESYGAFPMALDAWWNPAHPGYTALLPSTPIGDGRGFEGLQYLGAGMLLVVASAIVQIVRRHPERAPPSSVSELRWLLPAFTVLAALAIGPQQFWRGNPLATIILPAAITDLLDPIRASGRLAWPLTYALALSAVLIVGRLPRATLLLSAALALQIIDLAPMFGAIRATSARADDHRIYALTHDPRWDTWIAAAEVVDFQPPMVRADLPKMHEVTLRAILACRPVNYTYIAREMPEARMRLAAARADYRHGQIDPRRLYVLLNDSVPPALAAKARVLDGITVIPPSHPASSPACTGR